MATTVGTIGQVTGVVQAVDATGATRVLAVGDAVYAGETILTGEEGYVAINLIDGHLFDLGRNGQAELDSDLIAVDEEASLIAASDEVALSIEAIQAAIAAGLDPTQLAPATAAGPAAGAPGFGPEGSGHSFVSLNPVLTDAVVGVPELDTEAFGLGFPDVTFEPGGETPTQAAGPPETPETPETTTVRLSASNSASEDGGTITYTASLVDSNGDAVTTANAITVTLDSGEEITIAADSSSGQVDVAVNRDDLVLEDDSLSDAIDSIVEANAGTAGAFENLVVDNTPVSTTITDDQDTVTIQLIAVDSDGTAVTASTVEEGQQAYYKVVALDPDGNVIASPADGSVDVTFTNGTAESADYTSATTSVALGAVFSAGAVNDSIADSGETFEVSISNATSSVYEQVVVDTDAATVTTTITDDDSAPATQADNYAVTEGQVFTATSSNDVLENDSDANNDPITVIQFATSSDVAGTEVDGANSIQTVEGGTVVMNTDGTFTYTAPVLTHTDAATIDDTFVYRISDGANDSAWETVTIAVADTVPTAIDDDASVDAGQTITGNVLTNDTMVDEPGTVLSVSNGVETVSFTIAELADGDNDFLLLSGDHGELTISEDGSFSYTASEDQTTTLDSPAEMQQSLSVWGFNNSAWKDGDGKLTAESGWSTSNIFINSGSKDGLGVKGDGAGWGSGKIDDGETFVIKLGDGVEVTTLTVGIAQFNEGQNNTGTWSAYDSSGVKIDNADGTFVPGNNDGSDFTITVSASSDISYLVFSHTDGSGNNAGYVISDVSYSDTAATSDTFTYTMTDSDGDPSFAGDLSSADIDILLGE